MRCSRVTGVLGSIGALARTAALRLAALRLPLPPHSPATLSTPSAGRPLLCLHPLLASWPSGAQRVRGRRRGHLVIQHRSGHLSRGSGHVGGLGDPAEPQGHEVGGLGQLVVQLVGWADQGAGGLQVEDGGLLSICPLLLLLLFVIFILKQSADLDE